jgi:uncharacterized repeat protein (TIGR01451 family)
VAEWAAVVAPLIEQPVGSTDIELVRGGGGDWILGNLVTDGMRWKADLLDDGELNGSVDLALTNTGGLRDDIIIPSGATLPYTVTWGATFNVMPFGNTLYLMDLTGAQLQAFFDNQALVPYTMMQLSGGTFSYYNDCNCPTPAVWGAYGVQVGGQPLDYARTYRIVTNNYSAAYGMLADGANRWDTYYDMQEGVNDYLATISPVEAGDIPMGRMVGLDDPQPNLVSSSEAVVDAGRDGVADAGELLTYTITLSNSGDSAAGLLLTNTLTESVTYMEASLEIEFPGTGFVAEVVSGVLTAHTDGYLEPPPGGGLAAGDVATITFEVVMDDPTPRGEMLHNSLELKDQFTAYHVAPAVLGLPPRHWLYLPLIKRGE